MAGAEEFGSCTVPVCALELNMSGSDELQWLRVRTANLGYELQSRCFRTAVAAFTNCSRGVYEMQPLCIG